MSILLYLSYDGGCGEAIKFYKSALGAKVEFLMRFKDAPCPPGEDKFPREMLQKVMHSALRIRNATVMATDGHCTGKPNFAGITLSLSASDDAEATRLFGVLVS